MKSITSLQREFEQIQVVDKSTKKRTFIVILKDQGYELEDWLRDHPEAKRTDRLVVLANDPDEVA